MGKYLEGKTGRTDSKFKYKRMVRGKTYSQVTGEINAPPTKPEYKENNLGDWGREAQIEAWKFEVAP